MHIESKRHQWVHALAGDSSGVKAQLAAGNIDEADALLGELTAAGVQARFAAITAWAQNDRCLILRRRGWRAEAVDCLERLAQRQQAIGERREAVNVLCNLGSTQGALERWAAAVTLEQCHVGIDRDTHIPRDRVDVPVRVLTVIASSDHIALVSVVTGGSRLPQPVQIADAVTSM